MPDYDAMLDAQMQAFIAKTEACYPEDAGSLGIDAQRKIYTAMCARFDQPHPSNVTTREGCIGNVAVRWYEVGQAEGPVIVYFHGGGFALGGLESHDSICAEIAGRLGQVVIAVEYRLCPEHPHPAGFEDCLTVVDGLGQDVVLCGDSAGGCFAATLSYLRPARVLGQVLIYPLLGGDWTQGSAVAHSQAPLFTTAELAACQALRFDGAEPQGDPRYLPMAAQDFAAVPPSLVFSAQCDPLCDDGAQYCARLIASGGRAHWVCEEGLVHGYLRARGVSTRARASFERILAGLKALSAREWPFEGLQ